MPSPSVKYSVESAASDLAVDDHDRYRGASSIVDWNREDGVSGKIGRQHLAQRRPVFEHLAGGHVER